MFDTPESFNGFLGNAPGHDEKAVEAARERQGILTKPPGSLGRLEDIACWLAGWQGKLKPVVDKVQVIVFAGNHGVTARGVSPYPPEVTHQMVANFEAGGAAINAISDAFGHEMSVVALDLDNPTEDFTMLPAMSDEACLAAINAGANAVGKPDVLVLGEMGIGNTTAAAALAGAVFGGDGGQWAGAGTGLDEAGIAFKAQIVDEALKLHASYCKTPFDALARLGGRELAAIAGAVAAARMKRLPVILDGFIATVAAAALTLSGKGALDHCVAGHVSAEQAHPVMLEELHLEPLLDLGMRLGEGTGAALAAQVLKAAAATLSGMATFGEAGVSNTGVSDKET